MEDTDFLLELNQIVVRRASSQHLVDTIAFVKEVAERLSDDPAFGEFVPVEYQGTGAKSRPIKLHGFTELDEADGTVGLVIGKWSDIPEPETLTTTSVNQLTALLENFVVSAVGYQLSEKITESNEAFDLASLIENGRGKINRIRLHIFCNQVLSQRFKEELLESISGIPVERHIWDLRRLKAIYQSSREREAVEIDLSDFGIHGIPYLEAASTQEVKSYLCVVQGKVLADLFERYGSRLLEGNVRSFLGMKGGVNKGIRSTIQDAPGLFFAFNNGIAATASEVRFGIHDGKPLIAGLVDLQIVNGGQTTAAILNARKKEGLSLDGVTVQMKLTRVGVSETHELIPKIAEYANTQNKVAIADFFANHPFHRKMEEISRRLPTPARANSRIQSKWFYERSRGQYQNERLYFSKAKKDIFDAEYPSNQVINKTELAKYDSTWNCNPHWASLGAQKNFTRFAGQFSSKSTEITETEYWSNISPKYGDFYYQRIVAVAILWKAMEDIVHEGKGTWYQGDYRPQIVAYTLSRLFYESRNRGSEIDLSTIWNKQSISPALASYLASVAKKIQDVLLTPPEGMTNVGEWCKKEPCWDAARILKIGTGGVETFSVTKEVFNSLQADGKKQGIQDDGIALQKEVLNLTQSNYWNALLKWPQAVQFCSTSDRTLLIRASTLSGFLKITLEKDWRRLLDIRNHAEVEGFRNHNKNA